MAKPKVIDLALQGGGAHGAFTWGVLDRLLEDDRIEIEGICGTSAGAMNAVVVADGLDTGGKEGDPLYREELPRTAPEILNRINEITFNASLIKEIKTIAALKELISEAGLEGRKFKDVLFHRIHADSELKELGASSKLNTEWAFIEHLHDIGYRAASDWLNDNYDDLGKRSTLDIESIYLAWKEDNL